MTNLTQRRDLLMALTEGIRGLTNSGEWRRYLEVQSRFPRYSANNVLLIARQYERARLVAGFATWRRLRRVVRRGESAIWILAPIVARRQAGDDGAEPLVRGFRFVPVFDVAQTDGPDLPSVCHTLGATDPAGRFEQLVTAARSLGFAVERWPLEEGVNGDCSHSRHRIRVSTGLVGAQGVKTLAHELAHALLHERWEDRAIAELEAESTAFVVCRALGVDSGRYSFGYLATWAGSGDAAVAGVRASARRIQGGAARILEATGLTGATLDGGGPVGEGPVGGDDG
jgi:hypothetical protein